MEEAQASLKAIERFGSTDESAEAIVEAKTKRVIRLVGLLRGNSIPCDGYRAAADAVCVIGDTRVVEALFKALSDQHGSVHTDVQSLMQQINAPIALQPSIAALAHEYSYVRSTAINILCNIGSSSVPSLIESLADQNVHVRCSAAEALSRIHDSRTVEPLFKALSDQDASVREVAKHGLRCKGVLKENDAATKSPIELSGKDPVAAAGALVQRDGETAEEIPSRNEASEGHRQEQEELSSTSDDGSSDDSSSEDDDDKWPHINQEDWDEMRVTAYGTPIDPDDPHLRGVYP